ncbi:MAG: S1 RNA-binding domain-containing protein, partial [Planctomycetota bacterium]
LGQKLEFSVPPSRGGKSIIVSRRGILERELRRAAREHMKTLVVGEKVDGRVTQVRDYGLLVDIGNGVEGLVHQSEVSWSRGDRPADVAKPGDEVKVEILKVSPASRKDRYGKVSLSMRRCLPDPWDQNAEALKQGVPLKGKVVRTTEFGAFVELIPGIEGLLHVSELGRDVKHANQVLSDGQEIDVVIERKDKAQRRLSLSRLSEADLKAIEAGELDLSKAPASLKPGKHIRVKITRTEHHGLFAQVDGVIGKRGRGYIPNRELPISSDKKKKFSQGSYVDVKIIGTDRDGGLRLSIKGLLQDEERSAVREYRKEAAQQGGFGTFADLLKQKLGN